MPHLQYNLVPESVYEGLIEAFKCRNKITENKGGRSEAEDGNQKHNSAQSHKVISIVYLSVDID